MLESIAANDQVHSISLASKEGDQDASGLFCPIPNSWFDSTTDGAEIVQGVQIQQFLCQGFDGEGTSPYQAATIESGVPSHNVGLNDNDLASSNRVKKKRGCGLYYCNNADGGDQTQHSTYVSAILLGDLTNQQSSAIPDEKSQVERSGYAPEAELLAFALENGTASFETAVSEVINDHPAVTNISWGITTSNIFHDCLGDWDEDEAVNAMYESGIFPVVAAGNNGHASGSGCTVNVPGSAQGAFTVGGYSPQSSIANVRNGPVYSSSANGIYNSRRIVDIAAPVFRNRLPSFESPTTWDKWDTGTSFAAPTVSAAALDFREFYETAYSTWIRDPGAMTVSMLLMGDRAQSYNTTKLTYSFDGVLGSGRMKMRLFNHSGMDSPWGYGRYNTCIDQGEVATFNVGTLNTSVDKLKVVAFVYDRRRDTQPGEWDEIGISVKGVDSNGISRVSRSQLIDYNEKGMIHVDLNNMPQLTFTVQLSGQHVTTDVEGCGNNSMKVYVAWYFEDTARDDADGPGTEIQTDW